MHIPIGLGHSFQQHLDSYSRSTWTTNLKNAGIRCPSALECAKIDLRVNQRGCQELDGVARGTTSQQPCVVLALLWREYSLRHYSASL